VELFYDGTDCDDLRRWLRTGVVSGVTTNPALLDRVHDPAAAVRAILCAAAPRPVSIQVRTEDENEVVAEARRLAEIGGNVVVKIPAVSSAGEPMLETIHRVVGLGIHVNVTACLSAGQAILAALAGATYVSLLFGRVADEGGDPVHHASLIRQWLDISGSPARLILGSIRGCGDVYRALPARPHAVTLPPAVLRKLAMHRNAQATVAELIGVAEVAHA
jgi:transaldolase